jgi:hypothetical protein
MRSETIELVERLSQSERQDLLDCLRERYKQERDDLRQAAGWPTRTFNEWLDELPLDDNGLPLEGAPTMRMCLTGEQRRIAMMAWDAARDQA